MYVYGYARVSSDSQNLARQMEELKAFGIDEKYIFCDKASGKDFDRKAYNSLVGTAETLPYLHEGDLLVVYSIDRLGRNYTEIQAQWRRITKELKADIKVLDMPLLDTRGADGKDLDKTFISDLVLQILSYVAEKERKNIKARQKQGIEVMPLVDGKKVSMKTGRPTGRPNIQYPDNWKMYYDEWKAGKITATNTMELLGLKRNSFYKLAKKYEKETESQYN